MALHAVACDDDTFEQAALPNTTLHVTVDPSSGELTSLPQPPSGGDIGAGTSGVLVLNTREGQTWKFDTASPGWNPLDGWSRPSGVNVYADASGATMCITAGVQYDCLDVEEGSWYPPFSPVNFLIGYHDGRRFEYDPFSAEFSIVSMSSGELTPTTATCDSGHVVATGADGTVYIRCGRATVDSPVSLLQVDVGGNATSSAGAWLSGVGTEHVLVGADHYVMNTFGSLMQLDFTAGQATELPSLEAAQVSAVASDGVQAIFALERDAQMLRVHRFDITMSAWSMLTEIDTAALIAMTFGDDGLLHLLLSPSSQ